MVKAVVLDVDIEKERISLGIKQLSRDPWPSMQTEFPLGRVFEDADVVSVADYVLFVRLREGLTLDDALRERIRQVIRANTTPRHVPAKIVQVADIPRTISGKIVELAVRNVVHGRPVKNTDALANPEALELYRDLPELRD